MENEELEITNSQNSTEGTVNTNEESVEHTETEETEVDIDAEVKRQTAILFARMKKAEQEAKEAKSKLAQTSGKQDVQASSLSTKDLYALMEAKVPQDDIDEVTEYAKFKGISVAEALKSNVVKTMLSDKAEMRQTAQASNVGTARRGSAKVSDEVLLSKASKGELPDNEEDMMRVIRARKGYKN